MEDWRPIPTFPIYELCQDGRVRNKDTGKYLKINWINGSGTVMLYYKGRIYGRSVAKLLKKIFGIEQPHRSPVVTKCPNCGRTMGSDKLTKHLTTCEPRDPDVKYFEY
jgi:hypothetical protein